MKVDIEENLLRREGILEDGDNLFIVYTLPSMLKIAFYGSILASLQTTNYVLIQKESGIMIIPYNSIDTNLILDKKIFIKNNDITSLKLSSQNGLYIIDIMKEDICLFSFQISQLLVGEYKNKINIFLNSYKCDNREIIKKTNNIKAIILSIIISAFLLAVFIYAILEKEWIIVTISILSVVYIIYSAMKSKKIIK